MIFNAIMFAKFIIDYQTNIFKELSKSIDFEDITNGRQGAVLVDIKLSSKIIPIVRTTTSYNKPAQQFLPIHYDIIENIKKVTKFDGLEFNNALIEIYDSKYRSMKYHSDQSLDLADDSYICIFSCYDNPIDIRKLKIKEKTTGECLDILLENNSVVLFSLSTNSKYLHKIILESNTSNNKWLGITFRLSKTFIKFVDEIPYFIKFVDEIPYFYTNNKILRTANSEDEKKEFYKNRSKENLNVGHNYPEFDYTISVSDVLSVK